MFIANIEIPKRIMTEILENKTQKIPFFELKFMERDILGV